MRTRDKKDEEICAECQKDHKGIPRLQAVSWPAILQSYGGSVDVLSKDSKTLQLIVLDDTLHPLDISNTTDHFTIIVPRKSSGENGTVRKF